MDFDFLISLIEDNILLLYVLLSIIGISLIVITFSNKNKKEKIITNLTKEEFLALQKYYNSKRD